MLRSLYACGRARARTKPRRAPCETATNGAVPANVVLHHEGMYHLQGRAMRHARLSPNATCEKRISTRRVAG